MLKHLSVSHLAAGITAVVVGYSSAVILVIQAAQSAGASPGMITSWLLALGLGMGVSCIAFSMLYRMPVVTAWSTPGAAFLIMAAGAFELNEVIGAFITAGVLSFAAAQSRWLSERIAAIPDGISAALLAGIVLPICLNIFTDVSDYPLLCALFIGLYVAGVRYFPRYVMLCLLTLALLAAGQSGAFSDAMFSVSLAAPVWVTPAFSIQATISLALPLFLITMLSQNLPGMAILKAHNYQPNHRVVLSGLAMIQILTAPLGGVAYNYAAITAAICMGDNAGDDRHQRYLAAVVAGCAYIAVGLAAATVVTLFQAMPTVIIHLLAGLALLATLQAALVRSMEHAHHRHPALITLLCTASGMTLFQLGSPVWGLLLGLLLYGLENAKNNMFQKDSVR